MSRGRRGVILPAAQPTAPARWFERAVEQHPERTALMDRAWSLTHAEMDRAVDVLVGLVHGAGVGVGATVALITRHGLLTALLLHAAPRLGFTLFPLCPGLPGSLLEPLLAQAAVGATVSDRPLARAGRGPTLSTAALLDALACPGGERHVGGTFSSDRDIQLICATSGTTGLAKGVMLSGRNLAASVLASKPRFGLEPGDCWLLCLPLCHIGGLMVPLRCVEAAASVLIHDAFDPREVLRDLWERQVTHISLVPAMLARLLDGCGDRAPPPGLRRVLVGGGALSPDLSRRARAADWPICVTYGMTETASQIASDCSPGAGADAGQVGVPHPGVELRLGSSEPALPGRIEVRGGMVMAGYANPQQLPGSGLNDGWLETEDLGFLDSQGRLHLCGRGDDALISGGETVHPLSVERLLIDCPGIESVLLSACDDPVWGDRLVAVYLGPWEPEEVESWARSLLSGVYRPRGFLRVDRLPVDPDKPDRRALRQWLAGRLPQVQSPGPPT